MSRARPHIRRAAVGILRRPDGAVFMQQRRAPQSFDGFWEFPGGKVDDGETAAAALRRELREETGIAVRRADHFVRRFFAHSGGKVSLDFFVVREYDGEPGGREGQSCLWTKAENAPSPLLPANEVICKWLRLPPLYAITAAEVFGAEEMTRLLQRALAKRRFSLVQLRDKTLPPAARESFARRAAEMCRAHGAMLCANDDESLAAKTGCLHLSSRSLAQCAVRPPFEWVGASCHSAEEIARAAELSLDFAVLSPVKKTLSHVDAPPLGWRKFGQIAKAAEIPIYALGGLRESDLDSALRRGACGIAMMRAAWE